jgi:transcription elongation factor GreA
MQFLTADEKKSLEAKLEDLKAKRPDISNRIAEARAHGDLKENAEYHAAREEQGLMEAEIRRLEERLASCKVVESGDMPDDVVFVGSMVRIRDVDRDDEDVVKLVGELSGEFYDDYEEVSVGSPMGESLMKARVGDVVKVDTPRGVKRFEVLELL